MQIRYHSGIIDVNILVGLKMSHLHLYVMKEMIIIFVRLERWPMTRLL